MIAKKLNLRWIGAAICNAAMKILITGATGFIGFHVVNSLLNQGHEVVATSRSPQKAIQSPWYDEVAYLPLGLDETNVFERTGKPDAMIHLAWDKLDKYRDPAHFETILFEHYSFIRNLVADGLKQVLVTGTCLEYGMQSGPLSEDMEAKPVLAYPLGKHLLRLMLEGLQRSHPFTLQWVRLFYLHGPGQRKSSLISLLDAAIDEGRDSFDMSEGDQIRDYLPITEAADIIARIASNTDFNGIVNCCNGIGTTVKSLVERHARSRSSDIRLNCGVYDYPDYEPFAFWGDRTKLREVIA